MSRSSIFASGRATQTSRPNACRSPSARGRTPTGLDRHRSTLIPHQSTAGLDVGGSTKLQPASTIRRPVVLPIHPLRDSTYLSSTRFALSRTAHQVHPVEVHRLPLAVMNSEVEPLLVPSGEHKNGTPVLGEFNHSGPQQLSNASRCTPHENPGGDLQQPTRELPAQSGWAGSDHQDDHVAPP